MEENSALDVVSDRVTPARAKGRGQWKAGPVPFEVAGAQDGRVFTELLLPHIRKACDHSGGRFSVEGCLQRWLDGVWIMWAINDPDNDCVAVFFTQLNRYPDTGLVSLEISLLGGRNINAWTHLEPLLLEYARGFGATRVEAWSRSGLTRILPDWKRSFLIEREIELFERQCE